MQPTRTGGPRSSGKCLLARDGCEGEYIVSHHPSRQHQAARRRGPVDGRWTAGCRTEECLVRNANPKGHLSLNTDLQRNTLRFEVLDEGRDYFVGGEVGRRDKGERERTPSNRSLRYPLLHSFIAIAGGASRANKTLPVRYLPWVGAVGLHLELFRVALHPYSFGSDRSPFSL